MKTLLMIATLVALSACATAPEPIYDADQPYLSGKTPEIPPTRPQPRPRRDPFIPNRDCLHKHVSEDCDPAPVRAPAPPPMPPMMTPPEDGQPVD